MQYSLLTNPKLPGAARFYVPVGLISTILLYIIANTSNGATAGIYLTVMG